MKIGAGWLVCAALLAPLGMAQSAAIDIDSEIRAAKAENDYARLDRAAAEIGAKNVAGAYKLEEAALEIRKSVSGEKSGVYAAGLLKLAALEQQQRREPQALALYKKAADGDWPEAYPALIWLGTEASAKRDIKGAEHYLERARKAAAHPAVASRALLVLAVAEERNGRAAEADARFQDALSTAPENSGDLMASMAAYANFLDMQSRASDAAAMRARRDAIWRELSKPRPGRPTEAKEPVYRTGNGVLQPIPVFHPEPEYTGEARFVKLQGSVLLYIEVNGKGHVQNPRVLRPLGLGLDENAIAAVLRWAFMPGTMDGQPVTVSATVEMNYRLL